MAEVEHHNPLSDVIMKGSGAGPGSDAVKRALRAVRVHLGMKVAYVSQFVDGRSVFREVDAPGLEARIKVGDSHSLDDVYCRHILAGRLPELIPDTSAEPLAMSMPITTAAPIGKHMSVPIRLPDGSVYGMFCCLGPEADPTLRGRDLQMMRAFAELAAFDISRDFETGRLKEEKLVRIRNAIEGEQLSIAYQPIWRLDAGRPIGLECLARFSDLPYRSPDLWFKEAAETSLGTSLELVAIRTALGALSSLPADVYLAVNVSPQTALSDDLSATLDGVPPERVVLEITEHAFVQDYDRLVSALQPLRQRGVRLAVDDAGAGYASLQHILHLQPDLIKLDIGLTRNIDGDPARRALASALIMFARETGSRIIAEGVETSAELVALQALGVEMAQGYFLGRPGPLDSAIRLFDRDLAAPRRPGAAQQTVY